MIFTSKLKSFKKIEMKIPLVVLRTPPNQNILYHQVYKPLTHKCPSHQNDVLSL